MQTTGFTKPTEYQIAGSNLELFGSDVEKRIKQFAAEHEPSFYTQWTGDPSTSTSVGQTPGVTVWRVHNVVATFAPDDSSHMLTPPKFGLERVQSQGTAGPSYSPISQFYSGDSYIVLQTQQLQNRNAASPPLHDIYFWLGAKSTQDEWGVAAYKTVELDDLLSARGSAGVIQHREVQGSESSSFLALFSTHGGFMIVDGGYESGFHHVEAGAGSLQSYKPQLFRFDTQAYHQMPRIVPVELSVSSLSDNEAYLLDAGLHIYQWFGANLHTPLDKFQCEKAANKLRSDRFSRPTIHIVGGNPAADADFWKLLGPDSSARNLVIPPRSRGDRSLFRVSGVAVYTVTFNSASGVPVFTPIEFSNVNFKTIGGMLLIDTYSHVYSCWYPYTTGPEASSSVLNTPPSSRALFAIGQFYQRGAATERNDPSFLKVALTVVKNRRNYRF
jgi:hypothetical protein